MKLTEDVHKQIIETRKLAEFLTSNNKLKPKEPANQKDTKLKKEVDRKPEITYYELVNFINKINKESFCFTISQSNYFKQITRIHKWLITEENYMKSFFLKSYEVNFNLGIEQTEFIFKCYVTSDILFEDSPGSADREL